MFRFFICLSIVAQIFFARYSSAKELVTVSVFEDHERYVIASDSYGLSWRLLNAAAEHANLTLQIQESSWQASISRLQANKIDLVFAALKTAEREQWANFSLPLVTEGSGIFTRNDNPADSFDEIDLQNSVIGVSLNSVQEQIARDLGFENIYSTVQRPLLYNMLNKGRVDYLFFGKSIINYYCLYFDETADRTCMKQIGNLYHPDNVYAISNKENQRANKLLLSINQSLLLIADEAATKKLFMDYDKSSEHYKDWANTIKKTSLPN